MHVVSINAGSAELMKIGARTISTGIRKRPVERGHVGTLGLARDVVADTENHGGPDQALYLYSRATRSSASAAVRSTRPSSS